MDTYNMEDIKQNFLDPNRPQPEESKSKIWWILIGIVIVGIIIYLISQSGGAENNRGGDVVNNDNASEQTPQNVVENFYAFWASAYNANGESPALSQEYKSRSEITDKFVTDTDNLINSFGERFAFDPVTCANTAPMEVTIAETDIGDSNAEIIVDARFAEVSDRQILVRLSNEGSWKIDSIRCSF